MSHDQKPARVRIVASDAARRRDDRPADEPAAESASGAAGAAAAAAPTATSLDMSAVIILALFLIASIGGAVAMTLWCVA